ncbi:MAG: enoyl-CoA hydratase/isomerase family protein [Actinobacteria bacterium]|jgi:enoyl-CoA hydratase/carnithine racemase|nr:MAG: enoyl-CoA hydratase/isomerase family protein [Actinomycetota bacterium]
MDFAHIIFEKDDFSATIRLNRPEAMNAINGEVVEEIGKALDLIECEPLMRAAILTGTGNAFCVGADLKFILGELKSKRPLKEGFLGDVGHLLARLESLPVVLIGAVNGIALAGGLELLLCCDLIIAEESAQFGDAHSNYCLIPGGGSSQRLPRRLGENRAKQLLYFGDFYSARLMEQWGLVNEVVPDGGLDEAIGRIVSKLASKSPLVLRRMKSLVNQGRELPLQKGLAIEVETLEEHRNSYDMQEGLRAFKEKRDPIFQGH